MTVCDEGENRRAGQGRPLARVFLLWAIFFLSAWCSSFAQDPGEEACISGLVTIEGKSAGGIIIAGQRYRVEESTTILDATGNRISLCDLPLPCEAAVEYRLIANHEPLCLRIEILRVLKAPHKFVIVDDTG